MVKQCQFQLFFITILLWQPSSLSYSLDNFLSENSLKHAATRKDRLQNGFLMFPELSTRPSKMIAYNYNNCVFFIRYGDCLHHVKLKKAKENFILFIRYGDANTM